MPEGVRIDALTPASLHHLRIVLGIDRVTTRSSQNDRNSGGYCNFSLGVVDVLPVGAAQLRDSQRCAVEHFQHGSIAERQRRVSLPPISVLA